MRIYNISRKGKQHAEFTSMSKVQKVRDTFVKILGDPERDFSTEPITQNETERIVLELFLMSGDPEISDDLAHFYLDCISALKPFISYQ